MDREAAANAQWVKSSQSSGNGQCVEVAEVADGVVVRDSKEPDGPYLTFTRGEWSAFVGGAANGEFSFWES